MEIDAVVIAITQPALDNTVRSPHARRRVTIAAIAVAAITPSTVRADTTVQLPGTPTMLTAPNRPATTVQLPPHPPTPTMLAAPNKQFVATMQLPPRPPIFAAPSKPATTVQRPPHPPKPTMLVVPNKRFVATMRPPRPPPPMFAAPSKPAVTGSTLLPRTVTPTMFAAPNQPAIVATNSTSLQLPPGTPTPTMLPAPGRVMFATGESLPAPPLPPPPPELTVLFGVEVGLGGIGDLGAMLMIGADASWRMPGRDLWVRGGVHGGIAVGDITGGSAAIAGGGIEWRGHDCSLGCTYTGIELAFFTGNLRDDPDETDEIGGMARVRAGLDLGGHGRVRLGVEIDVGAARKHDFIYDGSEAPGDMFATTRVLGFALTVGALVGS